MKSWMMGLLAVSFTLPAYAAVPKSLIRAAQPPEKDRLVREALRLPRDNRIQALKSQGPATPKQLENLAFDRQQPLEIRWRALTALPHLNQRLGQQAIEKALVSDEWYLRNAATLALPSLPREIAVEQSAKLLSDPALVVRTAAAQNLLKLNAKEKEHLLWEKITHPENFRNGESLWIRRHLARALAEMARAGNEAKFIGLLNDKDSRLHPFAIRGLERLTGKKQGTRTQWLAWWRDSKISKN